MGSAKEEMWDGTHRLCDRVELISSPRWDGAEAGRGGIKCEERVLLLARERLRADMSPTGNVYREPQLRESKVKTAGEGGVAED
jgi:hypothetical protein